MPRGLAYTTVAKVLDRRRAKGLLTRRRAGKAFVYTAKIGREQIERATRGHDYNDILDTLSRPLRNARAFMM